MNTRHASRWSWRHVRDHKSQSSLFLRFTICLLAIVSAVTAPITVTAANSISVSVICSREHVQDADVKLFRIGENGEREPAGEARTDKKGKAKLSDFKFGMYELVIVCGDAPPITYKFAVLGGEDFSHTYLFRCCPPDDKGPRGLAGVDGRFATDEEKANTTIGSKTATTPPDKPANAAVPQAPANASARSAGGITVVTFNADAGRINVNLPDDMRAGDTISGTVIAEPKGQTKEERAKNQTVLNGMVVEINGKKVEPFSGSPAKERESVIQQTFWIYRPDAPKAIPPLSNGMATSESGGLAQFSIVLLKDQTSRTELGRVNVPTHPSGAVITPDPKTTPTFTIPVLGQTGRPIVITGLFDGDSSNTGVSFEPTVAEATTPSPRTGGWVDFGVIAESPRQVVVTAPSNVTGPIEIRVKEGAAESRSPFRNVGVNLSAPKTNLVRGEKTELRVEVNGLQGLKQPVPLTLSYRGVIVMDGGPYQPLLIQPSQVGADGRYTTTRGITGIQAGGWDATATVVTSRFDFCLQDDTVPARVVLWNTFTGDYLFNCPGCLPGNTTAPVEGQQSAGSTSSFSGKGSMVRKGCIITLTHNAPDRRVFATLDPCTSSGSTTVESPATKTKFTITDRNIADNTCP